MIQGAVLLRQSLWSALGWILPALAALWAVPGLTRALGATGFGLLAIAWSLVGWFSAADLGLSRAVTQGVARAVARDARDDAAALTWSALALMTPASIAAAALLWAGAPWVAGILKLGVESQDAGLHTIRWIALAIPATVLMTALRGVLEGTRSFALVSMLRIPLGIAFALVPLALAVRGFGVVGAVQGIVLVRVIALIAHGFAALATLPELRRVQFANATTRRSLLAFGGWTTVSNVISPLMNAMDRVGIAALIPVAAVASYALAFEVGTKIWILTATLVPVMYPSFAALLATDSHSAAGRLEQGNRAILAVGTPVLIAFAALAVPGMTWWVGKSLSAEAALSLQWLSIGLAANLSAQVALAFVQAADRPSLAAWGHIVQLPLYVLCLVWAVPRYGAAGAAAVWSARAIGDALWLLIAAGRADRAVRTRWRSLLWWSGAATVIVGVVAAVAHAAPPAIALLAGLSVWGLLMMRGGLLNASERGGLWRELTRLTAGAERR
ncbi:MAG: oligosaccharide flippase family protein [Gemmatimonadaceae bacterium]